ncbi:MAG TPA: L-fucose/L-arabinose isomerase family protein [Armatimonadota bacterium]|nr:L-fucose/L-arabinose isomerase family protein [Armatimonadota bacterium]HOQ27159.1 L-fucose/L-arabinose isomerase family protein [Armatimonadota bacterium]HPO74415.1 L-fucose/L-arabinose isomerase family protein [Armatimonadota bacterium]
MENSTLGVIIGNRGFFPDHLCEEGRKEILSVLSQEGFRVVALSPEETPFGSVESREDAKRCADLFKRHASEIDGVLVTLPNFGDERGVAETLRLAGLNVPVLVHAFPDVPGKMTLSDRRDSFCGKLSVCNNLRQFGIRFSLTRQHTMDPQSPAFREDLRWFDQVCRVVKGLRSARVGAIGSRPAAFNTVRYSEKILEAHGISVEVVDLSEILGRIGRLYDTDGRVHDRIALIREYQPMMNVPEASLLKMAKLAVVLDEWIEETGVVATAMQCWTSIEEFYGVAPCTVMSMMSNRLLPSACEVDITGAIGMYALTLATGVPAALLDWNNNYGEDPDKCVLFHCSNVPKACFSHMQMGCQDIVGSTVGFENAHGTCVGRIKPGPFTFARVSTDDLSGRIRAYAGEGEFTEDPLETFGGAGVAHIPDLQRLLHSLCANGFEHHVAIAHARVARALGEAMGNYLGWDIQLHNA